VTIPPALKAMLVDLLDAGRYETGGHVVAHAFAEGFVMADVRAAIRDGIIIEDYPDRRRCLIVARVYCVTDGRLRWLHVVCDYGRRNVLGIVTAYVPDSDEWGNPPVRRIAP
jgi:hypothetical protein